MMPPRPALGLVAICVTVHAVLLSGRGQDQQRPPAIRTGITVVPFDVRVIDRDGKPITDLRKDEFTIVEDGVPQKIEHFSTHRFVADPSAALAEPVFRKPGSDALATANRRVFLLVLGRGRHQDVSKYVDALVGFVRSRVLPQDQIALFAWNRATDFTTEHEHIVQTLVRFRDRHSEIETQLREWFSGLRAVYGSKEIPPQIQREIDDVFAKSTAIRARPIAPTPVADAKEIADDTRRISDELRRAREIADMRAAGGSPLPDLVAESTAETIDMEFDEYVAKMTETLQDLGNLYAGIAYLRHLEGEKHMVLVTERGVSPPRQESNARLARLASDARIALDIIQTGGVAGAPLPRFTPQGIRGGPVPTPNQTFGQTFAIQDLRLMADITGGQLHAFRTGDDAFRRLSDATAFQYLLGYYPSNTNWDGRFRKVTIEVKRPGARVMYRQGYFATDRLVPMERREFVTTERIRAAGAYDRVIDHIKVSLGKPVVAATAAGRELAVDVTVDITRVKMTLDGDLFTAALDVALFCGTARNEVVCQTRQRADLKLSESVRSRLLKEGAKFRITAAPTDDVRTIKIVVYDYGADLVGTAVATVR